MSNDNKLTPSGDDDIIQRQAAQIAALREALADVAALKRYDAAMKLAMIPLPSENSSLEK